LVGELIKKRRGNSSGYQEAKAAHRKALVLLTFVGAPIIGSAILIAFLLRKSLVSPINRNIATVHMLACGNLTVDVRADRKDEFGEEMNALRTMAD